MSIELLPMTRERMHELFRGFVFDPVIFDDMALYEKVKDQPYDPKKVDALFDKRRAERGSFAFAVMLGGEVIGEVGLRHFSDETKQCELSIHLRDDSVKDKGYGTQAERLAIDHAFGVLGAERVTAECLVKNARSRHVLEKLGFAYLGERDGFGQYELRKEDKK